MATARKLPSGSWRVRVYDYTDASGTKHYRSFTADTKTNAERLATSYSSEYKVVGTSDLLFRDAVEGFITQRAPVLSRSTLREYKGMQKRYMTTLMPLKVIKITQADVQREINILAKDLAPKSVKNIHGFISAVLAVYRPDFALHTVLPKKVPPQLYIPSEDEIKRLLGAVSGTELELPVLLAAFGPMRRGEICALRAENISGNVVHVCENMILTEDNEWIVKTPKSYAGDRYIDYPDFVADKWKDKTHGRLVEMKPSQLTDRFFTCLDRAGLPHFRFHDLRHYSASLQHALGVPDAYIMERGGWANDGVLKAVYRHTLEGKTREMNEKLNARLTEMYDTKNSRLTEMYDTKYDTK